MTGAGSLPPDDDVEQNPSPQIKATKGGRRPRGGFIGPPAEQS
jgi:hypothetical protein